MNDKPAKAAKAESVNRDVELLKGKIRDRDAEIALLRACLAHLVADQGGGVSVSVTPAQVDEHLDRLSIETEPGTGLVLLTVNDAPVAVPGALTEDDAS